MLLNFSRPGSPAGPMKRPASPSAESAMSLSSSWLGDPESEPCAMGTGEQAPSVDTSPAPELPASGVRKHEKYYFQDASVQLLVESTVYSVSRTPLVRHSAWFRERLEQPAECLPPDWTVLFIAGTTRMFVNHAMGIVQAERPGVSTKGASEHEGAVQLYGASKTEFDALLEVLYPDDYNELDLTIEQWTAVLKLSTLWSFVSVRALAVRQLERLLAEAPLERLVLARTYDVDDWIDDALTRLIEQDLSLDLWEASSLSVADLIHVARERETRADARAFAILRAEPLLSNALADLETARRKEKEEQEQQAARKAADEVRAAKEQKEAEERLAKERVRQEQIKKEVEATARVKKAKRQAALKAEADREAYREAAAEAQRKAKTEREAADAAELKAKAERELAEALERKVKAARELAELNARRDSATSEWGQFAAYFSNRGEAQPPGSGLATSEAGTGVET